MDAQIEEVNLGADLARVSGGFPECSSASAEKSAASTSSICCAFRP